MAAMGRDRGLAGQRGSARRMTTRCVLYARTSLEEGDKYGLKSQLTELRDLAKKRGYDVVGTFADDGCTGANLNRPQLEALRQLVRVNGTDVVLAHALDRLSRELVDQLVLDHEFRRAGTRIEYVTHTPDNTPIGQFREQIVAAVAQLERANIRDRTSRGRREQARQGKRPGGRAPYGYHHDASSTCGLAIDDVEAPFVKRAYEWMADGASLRDITHRLTAQGCRMKSGTVWDRSSVRHLLRNEVYCGVGHYNRRKGGSGHRDRPKAEWIAFAV